MHLKEIRGEKSKRLEDKYHYNLQCTHTSLANLLNLNQFLQSALIKGRADHKVLSKKYTGIIALDKNIFAAISSESTNNQRSTV